ncbi:MAG: hypothetical protein CL858_26760 [Cupriavidus sp.]|nr:hypothetical protein [Cupriavidus sp.]MBU68998.1 hypothetical protein [Cupriavidus sp.]
MRLDHQFKLEGRMALPTLLVVQIDLVWSVIRLTTLQRALHEVLPHTQLDFWRTQMGATLDLAVIDWCKVFGSRSDDTHWTRLVPAERHDEIREGLLASLGMDVAAWNNYWDEMKTYRDTNAAHLSLNPGARSQYVPRLDAALQACRYYYQAYLYPARRADDP